jgi:hypothetical protein
LFGALGGCLSYSKADIGIFKVWKNEYSSGYLSHSEADIGIFKVWRSEYSSGVRPREGVCPREGTSKSSHFS